MTHILAINQGVNSTGAIIFDPKNPMDSTDYHTFFALSIRKYSMPH